MFVKSSARLLLVASLLVLASGAGAQTIAVDPGWNAPLGIVGSGWLTDPPSDPADPYQVTIRIFDKGSNTPFITRVVPAKAPRCNNRNQCFGGGTFTTKFTVAQIGSDRHKRCAELRAEASAVASPTVKVQFWLPSCLN